MLAVASDPFQFVDPEVGPELAEGHDHGQVRTDHPSFPVVQDGVHCAFLALEVEGFTAVLRVVEDHHRLANPHRVSRLQLIDSLLGAGSRFTVLHEPARFARPILSWGDRR